MSRALFEELRADLNFGEQERALLQSARPELEPRLSEVVSDFYAVIRENERMRSVFIDDAQIDRQKAWLHGWLRDVLLAEYDDGYIARHARVGVVHVRIGLDPRYMTSMMGILRVSLVRLIRDAAPAWDAERRSATEFAVGAILDVELTMMQEAYRAAHLEQLRAQERLATLGQFAASIGHELRNPLAVVDSSAHIVLQQPELAPRVEKHARRIKEQAELCAKIVSGVLDIARDMPLNRTRVSLAELARGQFESQEDVVLKLETVATDADPSLLGIVLSNLVENARTVGATKVTIRTTRHDSKAVLSVEDNGPGIPKSVRKRLFEPLVSGRAGGVGLGLALCKRIVREHGGEIVAKDSDTGGAHFIVRLDAAEPKESTQ